MSGIRRVLVVTAVVAYCVLVGVVAPRVAMAAPVPSWSYDCTVDSTGNSLAVCERLTYVASEENAIDVSTAAQTSALADEAHRADLAWWGVWALVGLAFVGLIAGPWWRAFDYEGKLGPTRG